MQPTILFLFMKSQLKSSQTHSTHSIQIQFWCYVYSPCTVRVLITHKLRVKISDNILNLFELFGKTESYQLHNDEATYIDS